MNVASRLEAASLPGRIQISPQAAERLKNQFVVERRGPVDIKGVGEMTTSFLTGKR